MTDLMGFVEEAKTLIYAENHPNIISLLGTCILDTMVFQVKVFGQQRHNVLRK